MAILLNKNYIFAQKQNLLLTKKPDNQPTKKGKTTKWIGNIMHPDFGYPFQLLNTYLTFQFFVTSRYLWKLFTFFTQEYIFDSNYVNRDVSETLGSDGNRNKSQCNYENTLMKHGQLYVFCLIIMRDTNYSALSK